MSKKNIFWFVFVLATLGAFVIWGIRFICDTEGIQSQIFFADHNDWFMDLFNPVYFSVDKSPYSWGWRPARNYLPFAYMIVYPLRWLYPYDREDAATAYEARYSQYSSIAACAFFIISFGMLFYLLYKISKESEVKKLGILAALFCSSITLFNLDRGNEQVIATAFLVLFLVTYRSEKKWMNHIGYIGLAMAAALKIYPALFGVLLLYEKKYKDAIFTIIYGLCFAILPFFWLNGGVFNNIRLLRELMEEYAELIRPRGFGLSSPTILMMKGDFGILPYAMAILSLISAPMLKAEWKKLMLLTMVVNMTSGEQSFYCMIFLFLPIVLFFNEEHKWYDIFYVLGFVLILSPIQYSWVGTHIQLYHRAVCNTICILIYAALLSESTACLVKKIFVQKIRGAL